MRPASKPTADCVPSLGGQASPYSILNVTALEEVLRERLEKRESGASDADVAVMKEQLTLFEPFGEEERPFVIPINSESSVDLKGSPRDRFFQRPPGNHGDFAGAGLSRIISTCFLRNLGVNPFLQPGKRYPYIFR